MAKIDGIEEEEQYATAVEVDGIRRTLDQFMKRQDASNEAMKKSLDDVLLSLSKLSVSAVEDKGSSFKGKKPQNPRPDHTHIPSTYGQDHYPEDINGTHHDTVFDEYDMVAHGPSKNWKNFMSVLLYLVMVQHHHLLPTIQTGISIIRYILHKPIKFSSTQSLSFKPNYMFSTEL